MLVKKYLKEIPLCEASFRKNSSKKSEYIFSKVDVSEKYGEILAVDFYSEDEILIKRFFTDGKAWITLEKGSWHYRNITNEWWYYPDYIESKESSSISKEFFKKHNYKTHHNETGDIIKSFISEKHSDKHQRYVENRQRRMEDHIAMFPELPKNINAYCNQYVFKEKYIVFQKLDKSGQRKCKCLSCNESFNTDDKVQHKSPMSCPKCGANAIAIAERYITAVTDKTKMLIMFYVDGDILKKWMKVERRYESNSTEKYYYEPYYYEINTKKCTYYYHWVTFYYTYGFAKTKYSCDDKVHVYADNIKDIYENGWHMNMNLERLRYAGTINLRRLFIEASRTERTWQLYKIGLYNLAECASYLPEGNTFEEVIGLSKGYLPALKKNNVTYHALEVIKRANQYLNEDMVEKLCNLLNGSNFYSIDQKIKELLKHMSFIKMINYFSKQKVITKRKDFSLLATLYNDYLSMAEQLNAKLSKNKKFDMTTMNFRFPADIKKAHDNISNQLTIRKNRQKEIALQKMYKQLEPTHSFMHKGLIVVIPKSIEDFIREGNSLSHCVGRGMTYIDSHLKGTGLTFFIRKKENIDKPYYTFTIYTDTNTVSQCHGKCHASPTAEINAFIKKFLEHISAVKTEIKSNVA